MALGAAVKTSINAVMVRRKISQRELARRCGWSQQYAWRRISTCARADQEFTPSELERVAEVLGVPVKRLLTGGTR